MPAEFAKTVAPQRGLALRNPQSSAPAPMPKPAEMGDHEALAPLLQGLLCKVARRGVQRQVRSTGQGNGQAGNPSLLRVSAKVRSRSNTRTRGTHVQLPDSSRAASLRPWRMA